MNNSSKKQKGRILVKWGINFFRSLDPSTHEVIASGAGMNKGDQQLPGLGVAIEWKNHETFKMGEWIDDLKKEQGIANEMVVLAFRDPRTPQANPDIYFVLSADDMYKLFSVKKNQIPDLGRIPKYEVDRVRESLRRLLKYLD